MSNTIESIEQGNKLIANFLGWTKSPYPNLPNKMYKGDIGIHVENMAYHTSWDWLMPVCEKIQKEGKDGHLVSINLYSKGEGFACECKIYNWGLGEPEQEAECTSAIEAVWQAVIQFIEWYNNQKSNQ